MANIVDGQYVYIEDLTMLEQCMGRDLITSWPICPSPIRLAGWMEFVFVHPDHRFASYIYSGLASAFRMGFDQHTTKMRLATRNHPTASKNTGVVRDYIRVEVRAGHLRPFYTSKMMRVSAHSAGVNKVRKRLSRFYT